MDAEVGKPLALAVRFAPDKATTKTPQQLVQMMNQSTLNAMSIGISYNGNLVRLRNFEANSGMIGRQLPQVVQVTASTARITTTTALDESTIVATLQGDVLLNQDYQTPVRIQVAIFASGYSRIVTRDGLIRAQYCAFSNRQINTSGITTYLQIRQAPYNEVQVYSSENATATLTLVNILGQTIATIYNGELASGTHTYTLPEDLQHGMYFVMLKSAGGVLSEMWVSRK